jgi:hypothetical protein
MVEPIKKEMIARQKLQQKQNLQQKLEKIK